MMGVALFAFLFGALLDLADYVQMWWNITQSVFMGGAGAATIGGLYWKKGTTAGAWAGMLTGSILSLLGITAKQSHGHHVGAWLKDFHLQHFGAIPGPLLELGHGVKAIVGFIASYNYTQISFAIMFLAVAGYVVVSFLTGKEDFNMDRMLHRGAYATIATEVGEQAIPHRRRKVNWGRIIGYDDHFTPGDKWLAGGLFGWTLFWSVVSALVLLWDYVQPWQLPAWSNYYYVTGIGIPVFFAVTIGIWLTWGGIVDSLALFQRLRAERINPLDNGAVVNHQNLDEAVLPDAASPVEVPPVLPASRKESGEWVK
jgi:SSS family solute:Na+ symporter